jgi:hypothetical protein
MAFTYDSIQSYTATGSQNKITFATVPQTFTDLVLVCNVRGTANNEDLICYLNSDDGTSNYNYYFVQATATNGSASGLLYLYPQAAFRLGDYTPNATTFGATETYFNSYSNTSVKKTMTSNSFNSTASQQMSALYDSTSAISTINIQLGARGNFAAGSTFSLYGIKAA